MALQLILFINWEVRDRIVIYRIECHLIPTELGLHIGRIMANVKLHYLDGRGLGEGVRLMLCVAGIQV